MSEAIMSYPTLLLIWIGLLSLGYLVLWVVERLWPVRVGTWGESESLRSKRPARNRPPVKQMLRPNEALTGESKE